MPDQGSTGSWLLPAIAVAAVLLFGVLFINQRRTGGIEGEVHPAVGSQLAALRVEPLIDATEPVDLEQLRGKVTLINFWGPWCYYCLLEMPHLVDLHRKLSSEEDFRLLSISCPPPSHNQRLDQLRVDSQKQITDVGATWPVYADPQQLSQRAIVELPGMEQGFGFPTTVLLDREGKVTGLWVGYAEGMELEMEQTVRKTLAAN